MLPKAWNNLTSLIKEPVLSRVRILKQNVESRILGFEAGGNLNIFFYFLDQAVFINRLIPALWLLNRMNWWLSLQLNHLESKTLYKKTVHRQESRACGDLCLVWMPSLQQFPRPSHLLISHSTKHWLLLDLTMIKPVSNSFLASVWALGKYCFVQMSSSAFYRTVFLYYVFAWNGIDLGSTLSVVTILKF